MAWFAGQRDAAQEHLDRAEELLAEAGPSMGQARVLSFSARLRFLAGDLDVALRIATEALALAEQLQLDELRAHALTTIGSTKSKFDGSPANTDLERALEIASAANSPLVAEHPQQPRGVRERARRRGTGRRVLQRRSAGSGAHGGPRHQSLHARESHVHRLRFEGAGTRSSRMPTASSPSANCLPTTWKAGVRRLRAYVRLARGDHAGAVEDFDHALASGRDIKDPQVLIPGTPPVGAAYLYLGREQEARELAAEALELTRAHTGCAEVPRAGHCRRETARDSRGGTTTPRASAAESLERGRSRRSRRRLRSLRERLRAARLAGVRG